MVLSKEKSLKALFPSWTLDHREIVWLWWQWKEAGCSDVSVEDFGTTFMRESMAKEIEKFHLVRGLNDKKNWMMIPRENLPDIEKNPRAVQWLTKEFKRNRASSRLTLPRVLSDWEYLVAIIDIWDDSVEEKLKFLGVLLKKWRAHLLEDTNFRWFKEADQKERCQLAWDWYQQHHVFLVRRERIFTDYDDLILFWDSSSLELDEKRFHVSEIKKEWKKIQAKKNQIGKKQSNFVLPDDVKAQLDTLAMQSGLTKKQVIEKLIRNAVKNGLP